MWVSLCRMGGPRASKAQRISTLQARDCTLDRRELLLYYIALATSHYIVLASFHYIVLAIFHYIALTIFHYIALDFSPVI